MKQRDPDPILILGIRFTKPLYWWEKGGRDCGRLRRFSDSDTKYQLRINNRLCVAEALTNRTRKEKPEQLAQLAVAMWCRFPEKIVFWRVARHEMTIFAFSEFQVSRHNQQRKHETQKTRKTGKTGKRLERLERLEPGTTERLKDSHVGNDRAGNDWKSDKNNRKIRLEKGVLI